MIDISSLPLFKGKKALVTGIANDQSIALGLREGLSRLRRRRRHHVSQREDENAMSIRSPRSSKPSIFMPLNVQTWKASWRPFSKQIAKKWGKLDICFALDRLRAERRSARPCRRLLKGWISDRHGAVLLVLYSDGEIGRATDEGRWNLFDHDATTVRKWWWRTTT